MRILGYGEDALTYWALTQRLDEFLNKLGDKTDPDDTLVIYRPSFGRGEGCFGEFDAIVATKKAVYLVESKWHHSSEVKKRKGEVILEARQCERHITFRKYHEAWNDWRSKRPPEAQTDCHAFWTHACKYLNEPIEERSDSHRKSILQGNICFVLQALENHLFDPSSTKQTKSFGIKDVLLFLSPHGAKVNPAKVVAKGKDGELKVVDSFNAPVCIQFPVLNDEGYFRM